MPLEFDHDAVRDNIDAWALGALDSDDARALESHLSDCSPCTLLSDRAREGAAAIGLAVPLVDASHSLRSRVMASASVLPDGAGIRRQPAPRWWFATAAAVLAFAIGAVAWGGYMQRRVSGLQRTNDRVSADATIESNQFAAVSTQLAAQPVAADAASQNAILDIVSEPDLAKLQMTGTSAAPSASGRYIWSRAGGLGALVATKLPLLAPGQSYCLWIVYANAWVSGGLFQTDASGTGRIVVRDFDGREPDHGSLRGFAVTIEPSTGAQGQKGPTVLSANLN